MRYYKPDMKKSRWLHARGKRLRAKYTAEWKRYTHHQARQRLAAETKEDEEQ